MRARAVVLMAAAASAAVLGLGPAAPAGAGGGYPMTTARDRYEPGQRVVMIGYATAYPGWRERGPYRAYLRVDPAANARVDQEGVLVDPRDVPLGPVTVVEVPALPDGRTLRASLDFRLPRGLAPHDYGVVICDRRCERTLGDLTPGPVWVGVDPPTPVVRDWPFTDPAVRWLADDALMTGPGPAYFMTTAAEVRAGTARPPAPSTTTVATAPPTTAARIQPAPQPESDPARAPGTPGAAPWVASAAVVALAVTAPWWLLARRRAHRAVRL